VCSDCGWDQDYEFEDEDSGLPSAFSDEAFDLNGDLIEELTDCPDCKGLGSIETAITQHTCDRCLGRGVIKK
jgi:hypothetical protein